MDLEKSYPALFELLWYSQMPCFDVQGVTGDTKDEFGIVHEYTEKSYNVGVRLREPREFTQSRSYLIAYLSRIRQNLLSHQES